MIFLEGELAIIETADRRLSLLTASQERTVTKIQWDRNVFTKRNVELLQWQRDALRHIERRLQKAGILIQTNKDRAA